MPFFRRPLELDKSQSGGAQFSDIASTRRHRPDYLIVLFMGLLMLIGLIVMFAIGPQRANVLNNAYGSSYSDSYFFVKQMISVGLALLAFAFMAFLPYQLLARHASKLLIVSLGLCLLLALAGVLHLGIAQETLGATRWFNLGAFGSLQPSELLKFGILIYLALFLGSKARQNKVNDLHETLIPLAAVVGISLLFVVVIQKDLGTGISIIGIVMAMMVMSGLNKRNGLAILALLAAVGVVFIVSAPHRMERVMTFLQGDDTSETSDDSSYHIEQAKLAIGTGGLFGVGIGNSVQSTGYLPEATNDSVFAIIGETFGFVGAMTILALFVALLTRFLKIMDNLVDVRLKLMVSGVFGWLGTHVILNIGSMIGLVPLTGITLPLLSYGGTSMLFIAAALGLVFQLSRYTSHLAKTKEAQYENFGSRRGVGRSRHSGRSGFTRN